MLKPFLMTLVLLGAAQGSQALSLESYLDQVRQGNRGYKAQEATDTALKLAILEPNTMLSPRLDANVNYLDDSSESNSPFNALRVTATNWDAALSEQFEYTGTHLSLGYKGGESSIAYPGSLVAAFGGLSPGFSNPSYFDSNGYYVSITQPLWKDFGARAYEVARAKAEAGYGSARFMNRYGAASSLFEAESSYIQLSTARQIAQLLQESLERNQKILEWTQDKYNDNLVDKVDVLQVQAALQQVQMGIVDTQQQLHMAQQKFNALRGLSPNAEVSEELEAFSVPKALPSRAGERLDVQAAGKDVEGKEALAEEVRERYRPDLSVFGTATTSGQDPTWSGSLKPDHPTYVVGLKLSTLLDLPLYFKVVQGAEIAAGQGKDDLAQKRLRADEDWADLKVQWEALQNSLNLAAALEAVQKEKAEREKKRYQDGRTTNFQVLRFDEDYNQARINTLRLTAQAGVLAAQADFYNGGGIQW
jgi:outer membrane protein TolC